MRAGFNSSHGLVDYYMPPPIFTRWLVSSSFHARSLSTTTPLRIQNSSLNLQTYRKATSIVLPNLESLTMVIGDLSMQIRIRLFAPADSAVTFDTRFACSTALRSLVCRFTTALGPFLSRPRSLCTFQHGTHALG